MSRKKPLSTEEYNRTTPNNPPRGTAARGGGGSIDVSSESGKEMTFELFKTFDGQEYTVYVREDGKRFYVDWEDQVKEEPTTYTYIIYISSLHFHTEMETLSK